MHLLEPLADQSLSFSRKNPLDTGSYISQHCRRNQVHNQRTSKASLRCLHLQRVACYPLDDSKVAIQHLYVT